MKEKEGPASPLRFSPEAEDVGIDALLSASRCAMTINNRRSASPLFSFLLFSTRT